MEVPKKEGIGVFLNQKEYKGQIIKEQFFDNKHYLIVTKNKNNGKYVLYSNDKKIAENTDVKELYNFIKGYGKENKKK